MVIITNNSCGRWLLGCKLFIFCNSVVVIITAFNNISDSFIAIIREIQSV